MAFVGYLLPPEGRNWSALADYKANGGYEGAEKAVRQMKPADVLTEHVPADLLRKHREALGTSTQAEGPRRRQS